MADNAASLVWADVNGRTRQTIIKSLAGVGTLPTVLQAASLAQVNTSWEEAMQASIGVPTAGTYQTAGDSAALVFQTASGAVLRVTLPAPSSAIFLADRTTVDPTNALVLAIIAAVVGVVSDGSGHAVASYIGGYYNRSRGTDLLTP